MGIFILRKRISSVNSWNLKIFLEDLILQLYRRTRLSRIFFTCSDLGGAEALFKKAAEKNYIGVALLSDKEGVYGLGIALTKGEIYYVPVEGLLTGDYICAALKEIADSTNSLFHRCKILC